MASRYSGYLSRDHSETPPSYRREFSSPSTLRKSDFSTNHRPSFSSGSTFNSKPPLFGTSYGSSSRLSSLGTSYSPGPTRSSASSSPSSYSKSPLISHRTFSKPTSFNRSISNDFGVSYTPKPAASFLSGVSSSEHSRSSSSNLTPFESRYSSSGSSNICRDPSTSTTANSDSSNSRETYSSSYYDTDYSKSNEDPGERCRTLTSRATSPNSVSRPSGVNSLSDTRVEKYPLTDTTRRRQLKNVYVQVDSEDLNRFISKQVSSKFSTPFQKPSSTADQILPKQSGFVPKNRNFHIQSKSSPEESKSGPVSKTVGKPKEEVQEDHLPPQSSFLMKLKPVEAVEKKKGPVKPIIGSGVSLKESIEKVKTWKKQMELNIPDYKDNDDDREWRKKRCFGTRNQEVLSGEEASQSDEASGPDVSTVTGGRSMVVSDDECFKESAHKSDKIKKHFANDKLEGVSGFLRKASSYASLPDLVELAEKSREDSEEAGKTSTKCFIGRLKDIDSLLDFEDGVGDDVDGDLEEHSGPQVSTWTDDGFSRADDIDDLLDADFGSSSYAPGQTSGTSGSVVKSKSSFISNNPFMRQTSSNVVEESNDCDGDDDDDSTMSKCHQIVDDLCRDLKASGQLSIEQLINKCGLSDRSAAYRKLQSKLKAESKFTGFETIRETLEYLKVNVLQLENCAYALNMEWKSQINNNKNDENRRYNCLQLQSSLDNDDDASINDSMVKMAVRVHALVDFLVKGKELRRVLFSLKKIFKNEPDCIKEFVYSDGLTALVKIAEENSSNSSYQCYILRAIGQLMLNVDGMNGIVSVNKVVQWLYQLVGSSSSLVSRTCLSLLIMFVSYSECNSFLFIQAVSSVSLSKGKKTLSNLMDILKKSNGGSDREGGKKGDPSLLVLILLNKTLESVPDQDSFFDVVDSLAEQGLDKVFWTRTSYGSTKPDFIEQMKVFENMIKEEDIRQLERQQQKIPFDIVDNNTKERKRVQSRNPSRRSVYYSKRDGVLQKEMNRRNVMRQVSQQKLIKGFDNNSISNVEQDKNSSDFKKDLAEGTFSGLIGKAKDGLIMSQTVSATKFQKESLQDDVVPPVIKSEGQIKWEEAEKRALERLIKNELRLMVKELDFTDVTEVDEINYLDVKVNAPVPVNQKHLDPYQRHDLSSVIPQPPPCPGGMPLLPPPPPPPPGGVPAPPGLPPPHPPPMSGRASDKKEGSKTLKLHWKEARYEYPLPSGRMGDTVWSRVSKEIGQVKIDEEEFGKLFHSKAADLKIKTEGHKRELTLLDSRRSNVINIALTALPQISLIKTAILNMDQTIINREGVEKILTTLLPSEEEMTKLVEAQLSQPDVPLGPAEQFLITISSISEVKPRLRLWLFIMDFDSIETEISDALSDMRQAMEQMKSCSTLKYALTVLLAVGNCLNSSQAKGFTLDFLSKVVDIKDSIRKRSLLHHLVSFVIQFYSDATDIFSEIVSVTRFSRVDWDELDEKLKKLEEGCKASWDDIRAIVKHDNNLNLKNKLSSVLSDFAERTLLLKIAHRRLMSRFRQFLLYFGYQQSDIASGDFKINAIFKVVSEFALEWRTTRSKILHIRKRKEAEKDRKSASSSSLSLSLSRSAHGSISADESIVKNISSKPPLVPTSQNNINNKNNYTNLLSPVPKLPKWPSTSSIGYASETESAYESGDEELLGAVMRSATASPSPQRRQPKESRKKMSTDRSSAWRSSSRDRNGY